MTNSAPCTAEENGDGSAATRVEAVPPEDGLSAEEAIVSTDKISRATKRSQEQGATSKVEAISRDERNDANEHRPQERAAELKTGCVNGTSQNEAAAEPVSSSVDPSSDVKKDTSKEEDAAAVQKGVSTDKISDTLKGAHVDVLTKGIASVLGPVMKDFDGGVESAIKSQSILASSIDRLTRELDKLLEDVPLQYATHHAMRLSGIRQQILSLTSSLRMIQRRMDTIEKFRAGYALKAIIRNKREQAPMEKSHSQALSLTPWESRSRFSADDKKSIGGQLSKGASVESNEVGNKPSGGLQGDRVQEESVSKNLNEGATNQELNDLRRASDAINKQDARMY